MRSFSTALLSTVRNRWAGTFCDGCDRSYFPKSGDSMCTQLCDKSVACSGHAVLLRIAYPSNAVVICWSSNCLSHRHSLATDMSLRMSHPERTMNKVSCKVQTVAMRWPSQAKTPTSLLYVEYSFLNIHNAECSLPRFYFRIRERATY